jgi:hypothetical protein
MLTVRDAHAGVIAAFEALPETNQPRAGCALATALPRA